MKHKAYIKGVITGILAASAVAAGACFGYTRMAGGVLSDSQHVQKLRFLEALIDQEYLGEKDEDSLAEGDLETFTPAIIQRKSMSRKIPLRKDLM